MRHSFFSFIILTLTLFSCSKDDVNNNATDYNTAVLENEYIVMLNDKFESFQEITLYNELFSDLTISSHQIKDTYTHAVKGFMASLSESQYQSLKKDVRIKYIEVNNEVHLPKISKSTVDIFDTNEPWGVKRIGGHKNYSGDRKIWIVDSGIDFNHPDLNVNTELSIGLVSNLTGEDDNGHGTHVAGTAAANGTTIYGVASGAELVAVKVLDANGSGYVHSIIKGIEYISENANPGDVVNISLSGQVSDVLDEVIRNTADKGILFSIAAGNGIADAIIGSPARSSGIKENNHPNIFTVTAFDEHDDFYKFSRYGEVVDISAPGVAIISTSMGGGFESLTGTSMAAPHVAGILLVNDGSINDTGYEPNNVTDGEKSGNIAALY